MEINISPSPLYLSKHIKFDLKLKDQVILCTYKNKEEKITKYAVIPISNDFFMKVDFSSINYKTVEVRRGSLLSLSYSIFDLKE